MEFSESRNVANEMLATAVSRSKRTNVAFAPEFFRAMNTELGSSFETPLAQLIQGGRGGEVRLRLYLLLTMMATRAPFDIRNPPTPSALARVLDVSSGSRRINDNLAWLEEHHFIERTKRAGQTPSIQLLDPTDQKHGPLPDPRRKRPWVTIPIGFWLNGWILDLSPTGVAVLFALIERLGGRKVPMYLTRSRRQSYGFSHHTWTEGRKELEEWGLLTVSRVPQGDDFDYKRLRNSYWIEKDRLDLPRPPVHRPSNP